MKVAVCLSGADRAFEITSEFLLKNIIIPLNADVFIHTWDSSTFNDRFPNSYNEELYKKISKKYKIENLNSNWNFINAKKPNNIVPMFYSIYKSFSFVPPEYDIVIRSRFDSLYDQEFIIPNIKNNNVYVGLNAIFKGRFSPRYNFLCESNTNIKFVADNFAIGDYQSMKKYCSTYLHLNNCNTQLPETCLAEHLDNNLITYQWYKDLKYLALVEKNSNEAVFESDYEDKVRKHFKFL